MIILSKFLHLKSEIIRNGDMHSNNKLHFTLDYQTTSKEVIIGRDRL